RLPPEEEREEHDAGGERGDDGGVPPPEPRLLDEPEDGSPEAEDAEDGADEVHAHPLVARLSPRHDREDERERDRDERQVDEKDPAPRRYAEEPAAEERPDHGRDPAPRRPRADRGPALLALEGGRDHRERARRQQRAGDPLHGPRADEQVRRRSERAEERCRAEG